VLKSLIELNVRSQSQWIKAPRNAIKRDDKTNGAEVREYGHYELIREAVAAYNAVETPIRIANFRLSNHPTAQQHRCCPFKTIPETCINRRIAVSGFL
jgi:hypothetical protein